MSERFSSYYRKYLQCDGPEEIVCYALGRFSVPSDWGFSCRLQLILLQRLAMHFKVGAERGNIWGCWGISGYLSIRCIKSRLRILRRKSMLKHFFPHGLNRIFEKHRTRLLKCDIFTRGKEEGEALCPLFCTCVFFSWAVFDMGCHGNAIASSMHP